MFGALLVLLAFCGDGGYAYSSGAPSSACSTLRPGSPHGFNTQTGNGGYVISVPSTLPRNSGGGFDYQAGETYTVSIVKSGTSTPDFVGFALQAVTAGTTNLLGSFASPGGSRQFMSCGAGNQAVTHTNSNPKSSEEFSWTAPTGQAGQVDFRYTVVQTMPTYYFALLASSDTNYMVSQPPTTEAKTTMAATSIPATSEPSVVPVTLPVLTDSSGGSTSEPSTTNQKDSSATTKPSEGPVGPVTLNIQTDSSGAPTSEPSTTGQMDSSIATQPTSGPNTKFAPVSKTASQVEAILKERNESKGGEVVVRQPSNCERTQCMTYVSIRSWPGSPGVLDIYMEGGAGAWVAVGFTATPNMRSADVIACLRYPPSEGIIVLDTWNNADANFNEPDENQQDVAINFGQYVDGRISCRVNRTVAGSGSSRDLNLDAEYYLLYGVRNTSYTPSLTAPRLMAHGYELENIPRVTAVTQNVVKLTEVTDDSSSAESALAKCSLVLTTVLFIAVGLYIF